MDRENVDAADANSPSISTGTELTIDALMLLVAFSATWAACASAAICLELTWRHSVWAMLFGTIALVCGVLDWRTTGAVRLRWKRRGVGPTMRKLLDMEEDA